MRLIAGVIKDNETSSGPLLTIIKSLNMQSIVTVMSL